MQVAPPEAAASIVVTAMWPIEPLVALSVLPELNPNQPNHKIKAPTEASGKLDGGTMFAAPLSENLPIRGPIRIAAAKAAKPPKAWMVAEPAKSIMPRPPSQPPALHTQCPAIG